MQVEREPVGRIDVTVDEGRLHVGANGGFHQGSINSYNNFLTKTIAWLFGLSVKINAGGEEHTVNRKSYVKFLENHGVDTRLLGDREFHKLELTGMGVEKHTYMRQQLSANTTRELAKKLFVEIAAGNGEGVAKYTHKGADLSMKAWYKEDQGTFIFADHFATDLPHWTLNPTRFSQLTPHMLALRINQIGFANFLAFVGAPTNTLGRTCVFSRQLVDASTNYSVEPKVRLVTETYYDAYGRLQQRLTTQPGLDVVSTRTKKFLDKYDEQFEIYFDLNIPGHLAYTPKPTHSHEWDTSRRNGALELF